ncbi:uncharacterized protein LOC119156866 [Falco rusticolus]|uniref:uncharacterized protein LOC119156866 n=1 Tax=Falco rusticolus TaxID=120794 RepID=UPI0018866E62|nr:uncharacterized protein LOC119156866 [Falco rusticolus]
MEKTVREESEGESRDMAPSLSYPEKNLALGYSNSWCAWMIQNDLQLSSWGAPRSLKSAVTVIPPESCSSCCRILLIFQATIHRTGVQAWNRCTETKSKRSSSYPVCYFIMNYSKVQAQTQHTPPSPSSKLKPYTAASLHSMPPAEPPAQLPITPRSKREVSSQVCTKPTLRETTGSQKTVVNQAADSHHMLSSGTRPYST